MNKVNEFEYGGYHFIPERQLVGEEQSFKSIVAHQRLDKDLGLCNKMAGYPSKYNYNHDEFYQAATDKRCDLFRCAENGKLYIPCANDLQEYIEEPKNKEDVYDKLTPQRKQLMDEVMKNLNNCGGLWRQGWINAGAPESAITGKKYRGVNNFFLTLVAMGNGYSDNRWATFNQIQGKGWKFKTDEQGKSLGKGAGAVIEFFELRDKETKQPFDRHVLDGMSVDEREEYMKENVFPLRKYYRVFNGDVIEGIPECKKHEMDQSGYSERAEAILKLWSETESPILYGGSQAYYHKETDRIHLPQKEDFYSMQEYYSTALHEVGHSTGHEKRLNRNMGDGFGTPSYAEEELRAEIASMFIAQDLEIEMGENHIQNNAAYIESWKQKIQDNPNVLFEAIADADRIAKYVMAKEQQKEVEHFAVEEDTNDLGEPIYRLYMTSEHGQIRQALTTSFDSREELMAEVGNMQDLPFYAGKEFKEVSLDELQEISVKNAEAENQKSERRREEFKEQQSDVYILPSEIAAQETAVKAVVGTTIIAADMTGRGIESLTYLSDRDVVERARATKSGERFDTLYNGGSLLGNETKDERSLLCRLAMFTSDEEQLLRILKSSGQYRDEKPNAYYQKMIKDEIRFIESLKDKQPSAPSRVFGDDKVGHRSVNAKS